MNQKQHGHEHSHDDIGCLEAIERLYTWLDGELDRVSIEQLEQHLEHCRSCYSRKEMERALTQRIREVAEQQPSANLRDRLARLFDEF